MKSNPGVPFFILGVVFLALAAAGRGNYLAFGAVFLAIGAAFIFGRNRSSDRQRR